MGVIVRLSTQTSPNQLLGDGDFLTVVQTATKQKTGTYTQVQSTLSSGHSWSAMRDQVSYKCAAHSWCPNYRIHTKYWSLTKKSPKFKAALPRSGISKLYRSPLLH